MKITMVILTVLGIGLMSFGYWGLETQAGQHAYDEMAGIVPGAAGLLGAIMLFAVLVIMLVRWWSARRRAAV